MFDFKINKFIFFPLIFTLLLFPLNIIFSLEIVELFKLWVCLFLFYFCAHGAYFLMEFLKFYLGPLPFYGLGFLIFLVWWGSAVFHLVSLSLMPYSSFSLFVFFFVSLFFTFYHYQKRNSSIPFFNSKSYSKKFIFDLSFFIFIFFVFLIQSSFHSAIYWGEKPMDVSFISSYLRASSLPLNDPWLSFNIPKYYIWGPFLLTLLPKMAGASVGVVYHSILAFLFSLNVWIIKDLLNFFLKFKKQYQYWALSFFVLSMANSKSLQNLLNSLVNLNFNYNFDQFWGATRIYPAHYFTEFPSWSYLFADLHPHVMNYPFFAAAIFLLILYVRRINFLKINLKNNFIFLAILSSVIGALAVISSWDYILFLSLFAFYILFHFIYFRKKIIFLIFLVIPFSLLFYWPQLFYQFGGRPFLFEMRLGNTEGVLDWAYQFLAIIILLLLNSVGFYLARSKKIKNALLFPLVLLIPSALVLFLTKYFYLLDPINTVFKFHTSIFYLFNIILAIFLLSWINAKKLIGKFIVLMMILLSFSNVPAFIILAKGHHLPTSWRGKTLDGLQFLISHHPELYQLIKYANHYIKGQGTVIESFGESFQHERNVFSSFTGLRSFLGWKGHVFIRGASPELIYVRQDIISQFYQTPDALAAYHTAKNEKIDFILISREERDFFGNNVDLKFKTFSDIFPKIICFGETCLYGVKGNYEKYLGRTR